MIADSLPDDFGNAVIDAWLSEQGIGKDEISSLDRLAYAGNRALGALTFSPSRSNFESPLTAIQIADIVTEARQLLAGKVANSDSHSAALTQLIQVGSSAGGARAKAVVQYNPTTDQLRSGYGPKEPGFQPWILKLDGISKAADGSENSRDAPSQFTRIEFAYYLMAIDAGITMNECRLLNEGPRAHFITRRFDSDDAGNRIHMQSLCAMDHLDFRYGDTHSYSQYFNVIRKLGMGQDELAQAYRRMVFNVVAMNRDDHTKNFAFLLPKDGSWSLSPAFDITHAFNPTGRWTQRHQMSVNGKFEGIRVADFEAMGDSYGIPNYKTIISSTLAVVSGWKGYAEKAGVLPATRDQIANDFAEHRP
jgi:serine/threonine-protein kinase HipA